MSSKSKISLNVRKFSFNFCIKLVCKSFLFFIFLNWYTFFCDLKHVVMVEENAKLNIHLTSWALYECQFFLISSMLPIHELGKGISHSSNIAFLMLHLIILGTILGPRNITINIDYKELPLHLTCLGTYLAKIRFI